MGFILLRMYKAGLSEYNLGALLYPLLVHIGRNL